MTIMMHFYDSEEVGELPEEVQKEADVFCEERGITLYFTSSDDPFSPDGSLFAHYPDGEKVGYEHFNMNDIEPEEAIRELLSRCKKFEEENGLQ